MADSTKTSFINIDLEVRAAYDLSALAQALEPHAMALSCTPLGDGHLATFELNEQPADAETGIRGFLRVIDDLPAPAKDLWTRATQRDFSIGIDAGSNCETFELALDAQLLAQIASVGARVTFVVYPFREEA